MCGVFGQADANHATSCWNPRRSELYAFSPICNSADLKLTPHEWFGQYPSGFFAHTAVVVGAKAFSCTDITKLIRRGQSTGIIGTAAET